MRVAFLSKMEPEVEQIARDAARGRIDLVFPRSETVPDLMDAARDAEVFITRAARVTPALLDVAPHLRLVHKFGIGVDKIDLEAVWSRGAQVAITNGANAVAVAEHAVLLILAVQRRLAFNDRAMRRGEWPRDQMRAVCRLLAGKTVGLVGFGNIGRATARRLQGFDCRIVYHDLAAAPAEVETRLEAVRLPLDRLLAESDVVSLHMPATDATEGMIGAAQLAAMPRGSVLVNTARGELVDEAALIAALDSGHLAGAGLDAFRNEPPAPDDPLLAHELVTLTPHSAGSVLDNVANVCNHIYRNIQRLADGLPLPPEDLVKPKGGG